MREKGEHQGLADDVVGVVSHVFKTNDSCQPGPALCRSLGDVCVCVCDRDVEEGVCGRGGEGWEVVTQQPAALLAFTRRSVLRSCCKK